MRKLDRTVVAAPVCLSRYSYLIHEWKIVKNRQKKRIWEELDKIQNKLCVYCEGKAERCDGHIEHFFNKGESQFKYLTFEWSNLFGCCNSTGHCGHFKDQILAKGVKRKYNARELIKPDLDDPEDFLQYLSSGKIKEKEDISEEKKKKALSTISALNLDCSELNLNRRDQIKRFRERLLALTKIELVDDDTTNLVKEQFRQILDEAMNSMYRTALKQNIA